MKINSIIVKERKREINKDKVQDLAESIKELGLINPITVTKGNVLVAGNHRIEAYKLLGKDEIEVRVIDKRALLIELAEIDENLIRNELHYIDRGNHFARKQEIYEDLYAETRNGGDRKSKIRKRNPLSDKSSFVTDTSKRIDKSETVIREELHIAKNISTELKQQIKGTDIGKTDAFKISRMKPEEQIKVVEKIVDGAKSVVDATRLIRKEEVHETPTIEGKYRIIYADCPWNYGNKLVDGYGAAENHYPTMSIKELCELPVKEIAEDNAVLFFWVTSPLLEECFPVINSWGFKYKTSFVWDKVKHNMGHYNSVRHELLLICTRGSCLPDSTKLLDSVVEIERSQTHSEKPEEFRNIINTLYTFGSRIELFSRKNVEGWNTWGNQS
jgi:N6-adenosine-specific RNA methylase IME4